MHGGRAGKSRLGHAWASLVAASCLTGLSLLAGCTQEAPPPLAAALVVVDTDLPVPRTVTRLRVDIYGTDGTWLHSRDMPLARADEWPASFGVFSPDESKEATVLVRLRAYAEGATRDYRGARIVTAPTYTPPWTATSNAELCAKLETLPAYEERTLRRSETAIITDTCSTYGGYLDQPNVLTGSVAVKVEIPASGRYRFEVVRSIPESAYGTDTTLSLRRDCLDAATEIACADEVSTQSSLSRLVVDLQPGTYTLLTGGAAPGPADLTLRWAPASEWSRTTPPEPALAPPDAAWPRLVIDGKDATPAQEPHPAATVDRLVRVRLVPGVQSKVRVTLEGICAGAEATLVPMSDRRISGDAARGCSAGDFNAAVALAVDEEGASAPSAVGTFANEPCDANASDDAIACVPGGAYVMGSADVDGVYLLETGGRSLPVRMVALHRFYIDRREVTVGRYRQAAAAGLNPDLANRPLVNDGPFAPDAFATSATFSTRPMGREAYPLNTVGWKAARALCVRAGGDLPTEAQWEYAAAGAGVEYKRTFPTGSVKPSCEVGVIARDATVFGQCTGYSAGPEPVDSAAATADTNALGILGMTGNVAELARDAYYSFDHPCWAVRGVFDPHCEDPATPFHIARGGSWRSALFYSNVTLRQPSTGRANLIGFRCVYETPPEKRWRGP